MSSSLPFSSSTTSSTMAPKKKPGAVNHPSTSRALPPATASVAGNVGTREDVDAAGDVVGAGAIGTAAPIAKAKAGGTGEGQHQQHPSDHAPRGMDGGIILSAPSLLAEGHRRSGGARSGADRIPQAAPTVGATTGHTPPLERADPATMPNRVAGPPRPPLHQHAIQAAGSQQQGHGAVATGTIRSQATLQSMSSSPMPSTVSEPWHRPSCC